MSWLKTTEEQRAYSIEDPNTPIAKALMFLGDMRATITGRPMNDGAALALPAFYNGVAIISGDLATIPLKVYRRLDGGGRAEENGHALWDLLTVSPFDMITSTAWREACQAHRLIRGNSYTEIFTDSVGRVSMLLPLKPSDVTRKGDMYEIQGGKRRVPADRMLHVPSVGGNGIDGWSVITLARQNLSLASALEESNVRFIANAAQPSGFLKTPHHIDPETALRAKRQFQKKSAGLDHVGEVPVLDGDWEFQRTQLTAEDAAYIESRQFSVTDVARWLNIPPHKIGDLERATFSNIEHQQIDYVQGTLRPWAVRDEQAMNMKLLTPRERAAGLFIAYNLDGLLRGDVQARTQAYTAQFNMGMLTPNEGRTLENRNPVEGGDRPMVRLDMVPLDRIDAVQSLGMNDEGRVTSVTFETRTAERRAEYRSHRARIGLRESFASLFGDAATRMVRGEIRNVRRLLERHSFDELRTALGVYYMDEHPVFAAGVMQPVFRSYAESVSVASVAEINLDEVNVDLVATTSQYTDAFVARYSAQSRRTLQALESNDEIEARLAEWQDGTTESRPRAEQVASREVVRLGDMIARATWVAGGVTAFVWRAIGKTCPYCSRLDGRVVSRSTPFLRGGEAFEGEGTDVVLTPTSDVFGAPAHRGCDCTIVPG